MNSGRLGNGKPEMDILPTAKKDCTYSARPHADKEWVHRQAIEHMPTLEQTSLNTVTAPPAASACDVAISIMIPSSWK